MVDMVTDTNASVKRAYMGIMENNALIVVGKEVHPMHRVSSGTGCLRVYSEWDRFESPGQY